MNSNFCCPTCKVHITATSEGYACQKCNRAYFLQDGYVDFIGESEFYAGEVSKKEMEMLIQEIDSLGYDEGLTRFFKRNSMQGYLTDVRRIDWVCHCLTKHNLRCLDIGSGLGNISENLSHIYEEVYSLEAVKERIEFQKRRYKNSNRTNITIVRGNAVELPFPDGYFDLVVCNGVLEWVGTMNSNLSPREAQLAFLREAKRVLSDTGCLYVGIENRFGLPFLLGAKDHSGLPYTSLLPRQVANLIVKKFGYAGGIYGDKSKNIKERRGYYTYTYSIWGYRKLFKESGFRFKSFWVFPSYNEPYFSGSLEDKKGLKAFIRYEQSVVKRFKSLISIMAKMPKSLIGLIVSVLSPSFLFYCYKNNLTESIDDIIVNSTGFHNFTTLSEGNDIKYLLYDKKIKPVMILHERRYGNEIPKDIPFYDKTNPNSHMANERIWSEDWIPGKPLDPLKSDEIMTAIDWLIEFQDKTRGAIMTRDEIQSEVNYLRNNLLKIPDLNKSIYVKWIDDYQEYVEKLGVHKTAEHGDFWIGNILIDCSSNKINVIDWDSHRKEGNPFFDFIFLTAGIIQSECGVEALSSTINEIMIHSSHVKVIKLKIDNYFGFEINFDILVRYVLLRFTIRKQLERGPYDETVTVLKKLLTILSQKR